MRDEITFPFPNFNGCTVEVWEWISNYIPHFTGHVITYPCYLRTQWGPNAASVHVCNWHLMMTSSNGNIFRVTGHLCGEFTGSGEFPAQRPVTRSFDVFFDLHPNKRLSKQWWGWWFETPSCPFWRLRNVQHLLDIPAHAYKLNLGAVIHTVGCQIWINNTQNFVILYTLTFSGIFHFYLILFCWVYV